MSDTSQTILRVPVNIIPGANPALRRLEVTRNLIIVPTDQDQKTVRLNDEFRTRIGLDGGFLPTTETHSRDSGFSVIQRDGLSPLAPIVTSGGVEGISHNLAELLRSSLIAQWRGELERVWLPLLGIEANNLTYRESLQAILTGITKAGQEDRDKWHFVIATSADIDCKTLVDLRTEIERRSGREILDLSGALAQIGVSLDPEALGVLDRAARLMLAQRPPLDNGKMGTRSLLFALSGFAADHPFPSGAPVVEAFSQSLRSLANEQEISEGKQYFRDDLPKIVSETFGSPILFDTDLRDILKKATAAGHGPTGAASIALALLDRCEQSDPYPTHARRALDRMKIAPAGLKQAFQKALGSATSTTITYALMGNDNPDRASLDDKLGVTDEAHAFARVAAARAVDPPLAFGIFGDWGSGKSFFMRLIHEHVDDLANKKAKEAESGLFHKNIVQIRFNAWHYAETQIWASLVDNIFAELDSWVLKKLNVSERNTLFDNLATARDLTLESAERLVRRRQDQKVAAEQLADANRALTAAREKTGATPQAFWVAVRESFMGAISKQDLKDAATTLGLDHLAEDAETLDTTLRSLKAQGQRARIVTRGMRGKLLGAPSLLFLLAAIILVPPILLWLREWFVQSAVPGSGLQAFLEHIHETVLAATGILASATGLLLFTRNKIQSAVNRLEGFRDQLDKAIKDQISQPTEKVKNAQDKLAKLTSDVTEAQARLSATTDRLAEAAREYVSGTGRGRLLRFVRDRATNGEYAKHLGLIATVRKDFTELSAMMTRVDKSVQDESNRQINAYNQRVEGLIEAAGKEELLTEEDKKTLRQSTQTPAVQVAPTFDRIILYIDDLDRCTPEQVVKVLQAVHLLLTFPLFVVVVAVDVRWVSRSLETHYLNLIGAVQADGAAHGATARDYLEKIFQVPYWVRAMTPPGSRDLLMALARPASDNPPPGGDPAGVNNEENTAPKLPQGGQPSVGGEATNLSEDLHLRSGDAATPARPGRIPRADDPVLEPDAPPGDPPQQEPDQPDQPSDSDLPKDDITARIAARALDFIDEERAFMKALAPYAASTPRRALRFLNVYRVIKASLSPDELRVLEKEGGYRGLMTQLAIATEAPRLQKHWLDLIRTLPQGAGRQEMEVRVNSTPHFTDSSDHRQLAGAIDIFWSGPQTAMTDDPGPPVSEKPEAVDKALQDGLKTLKEYGDLARRYSFSA